MQRHQRDEPGWARFRAASEGDRVSGHELEELELLYRTAPVGMCVVDASLRFLRINELLASINGSPVARHIGRTIHEIIPDMASEVEPVYRRIFETGEPIRNVEVSGYVPSDPSRRASWLVNYHPLKSATGEVMAVSTVVQDITEQKRAAAALDRAREELEQRVKERTRQLKRSNEKLQDEMEERRQIEEQLRLRQRMDSLGTLAGGIAHDFNNLLQAVKARLSLLMMQPSDLSEEQRRHIEASLEATKRAADLSRRLGSLSDSTAIAKTRCDLYTIVSDAFSLLRDTTHRLIEKRMDFPADTFFVHADPGEIHQVLLNLGTNAVTAIEDRAGGPRPGDRLQARAGHVVVAPPAGPMTGDGSHVQVATGEDGARDGRTSAALREQLLPGRYIHLEVSDTGRGMPEEVRVRAFEPLYSSRSRGETRGQGLGLAMVFNIVVNRHGGHVELESAEGRGTTVHLYLPAASPDTVAAASPECRAAARGNGERILIVDDEDLVRRAAEAVLTAHGYRVVSAPDGEDAWERYLRDRPDLVVVDLVMPRVTGEMLCNRILEHDPNARIVLSSGQSGRVSAALLGRVAGSLRKPYEANDLLRAVRDVLDR